MTISQVTYTGHLGTTATHLSSGDTIRTDAPKDNRGKGEAFSPTDLLATSLACCMMTIMGIVARDRGLSIEGTRATVGKSMAEQPRRVAEVEVEMVIMDRGLTSVERAALEHAALNCPVAKSLGAGVGQRVSFRYEAAGASTGASGLE